MEDVYEEDLEEMREIANIGRTEQNRMEGKGVENKGGCRWDQGWELEMEVGVIGECDQTVMQGFGAPMWLRFNSPCQQCLQSQSLP